MSYHEFFGIAAPVMSACSMYFYIASILRGETKPNRISYWIWCAMSTMIFFTYRKSGGTTIWLQAMYIFNQFVIGLLSFKYGEGSRLSRLDKTCLALAMVGIPFWWALRQYYGDTADAALPVFLLYLFVDALGTIPVLEKSWNRPETENAFSWALSVLGATFNLFAVTRWGIADIVWNGWMWGAGFAIMAFAYLRPRYVSATPETTPEA